MKFSLLYTTARPHLISQVIERWTVSDTVQNSIELILVTDEPIDGLPVPGHVKSLVNNGRKDCVTGWNLAATQATGDVLIQVSDDLFPPKLWDRVIQSLIQELSKKRPDVVLNLFDERMSTRSVFHPVLTMSAYLRTGHLYPADFESMYCDDWFAAYHKKNSMYAVSHKVFWNHVHRITHVVERDEVMKRHESRERYLRGMETLKKYVILQDLVVSK